MGKAIEADWNMESEQLSWAFLAKTPFIVQAAKKKYDKAVEPSCAASSAHTSVYAHIYKLPMCYPKTVRHGI